MSRVKTKQGLKRKYERYRGNGLNRGSERILSMIKSGSSCCPAKQKPVLRG